MGAVRQSPVLAPDRVEVIGGCIVSDSDAKAHQEARAVTEPGRPEWGAVIVSRRDAEGVCPDFAPVVPNGKFKRVNQTVGGGGAREDRAESVLTVMRVMWLRWLLWRALTEAVESWSSLGAKPRRLPGRGVPWRLK